MRASEVVSILKSRGCVLVAQKGSHQKWRSSCGKCTTTVAQHGPKDIPKGTLRAIQKQMTPCLGKGWLLGGSDDE